MIAIEAKLERTSSLKTRTNIIFSTKQELNELELLQLEKVSGHLVFSPDEVKKKVEAAMKNRHLAINEQGKTPSQIIRGLIFRLSDQNGIDADEAYKKWTDRTIKELRSKLI